MGQATPTHHGHAARPLQVVCDASLQKQVHPHLLRMYLDQTAPTANPTPPRERWPCSQNRILLAWTACTQSAGSLVWAFMFQPLSNRERFSHRRWVLASLTHIARVSRNGNFGTSRSLSGHNAPSSTGHTWRTCRFLRWHLWMTRTHMIGLIPSAPCGFLRPRPWMGSVFPLHA